MKQKVIRRLKTAKLKFMTRTAGYRLLDHRGNEDILKVDLVEKKLIHYKQKFLKC
jgi:hypothetical protein